MIKFCSKHGETEFYSYKRNNRPSLGYKCKKCNTERVDKRRKDLKLMAIKYKGGSCKICDYNKCNRALGFHHEDPTQKDFGISEKGYTRSWEKIKEELDKCIMVCANCHAEIHEELK